jgi:tRNA threonylcarbamoyladenosine modification (KEOPS) complex Cgi121 subunit
MARRLKENVEILNNCINALRSNNNAEIDRNVDIIKKASEIVLKCSQIVDHAEDKQEIAETITREFLNYLTTERQVTKNIEVRLNQISQESLKKIEKVYRKNETYSKMASID